MVTASLLISAAAYAPFTPLVWPDSWTVPAVGSVVVLAVICTALAFMVMFALVAEAGPARMTVITYVSPAVASFSGRSSWMSRSPSGSRSVSPGDHRFVLGTWRSAPPPVEPTGVSTETVVPIPKLAARDLARERQVDD